MAESLTNIPGFFISLVTGAVAFVTSFLLRILFTVTSVSTTGKSKISAPLINVSKEFHQTFSTASKPATSNRIKHEEKCGGEDAKQSFNHQQLLTCLKSHSSSNLGDMDINLNGNYLKTSAEEETDEPDPGGGDESENSSGSEANKENTVAPPTKVLLSRRQKKNRVRKEEAALSSTSSALLKKMTQKSAKRSAVVPRKRWTAAGVPACTRLPNFKLTADDGELSMMFRNYLLTPEQAMILGYPFESSLHPGRAIIYKSNPPRKPSTEDAAAVAVVEAPRSPNLFDVNAREFVPSCETIAVAVPKDNSYGDVVEVRDLTGRKNSGDTMEGSECSSSKGSEDRSGDSDLGDDKDGDDTTGVLKAHESGNGDEKKCSRCGRGFYVMKGGEYLTQEKCVYHWGKLHRLETVSSDGVVTVKSEFSCCRRKKNSRGCSTGKLHVWSGVTSGVNGPLDGYVKTREPKTVSPDGNYGVYSMDCEMCYTTQGLELAKITVVATDGRVVYDSFVKPESPIIDYNTRFSGITAKDLKRGNSAKSLKDVQSDLMAFINADTILIGHGLENDLKALKMIHSTVIDTSVIFPHYLGLPFKRSLRSLVGSLLKRDIQSCGHDSFEDAKACMELMLWRVKKDFKNSFDQKNHYLTINSK